MLSYTIAILTFLALAFTILMYVVSAGVTNIRDASISNVLTTVVYR